MDEECPRVAVGCCYRAESVATACDALAQALLVEFVRSKVPVRREWEKLYKRIFFRHFEVINFSAKFEKQHVS